MKKATNRREVYGIVVVHEGLQNNEDLIKSLLKEAKKIKSITKKRSSHLSDIGLSVSFTIQNLEKIKEEIFKRHLIEKNSLKTNP